MLYKGNQIDDIINALKSEEKENSIIGECSRQEYREDVRNSVRTLFLDFSPIIKRN